MKTMCPTGCYRKGFVANHALGHMMYGYDGYDVRLRPSSSFCEILVLCVSWITYDHLYIVYIYIYIYIYIIYTYI